MNMGATEEDPTIVSGNKLLSQLNRNLHGAALMRAIDNATFTRDADVLEEMILKAVTEEVDPVKINTANLILIELREEKDKKKKALAMLENAVECRDTIKINDALDHLSTATGVSTGQEVDKAHRVLLEVKREGATSALKNVLSVSATWRNVQSSMSTPRSAGNSTPMPVIEDDFDEDLLCRVVEDADRCMPQDNELLLEAKGRLEQRKQFRRRKNEAAAAVATAMDTHDVEGKGFSLDFFLLPHSPLSSLTYPYSPSLTLILPHSPLSSLTYPHSPILSPALELALADASTLLSKDILATATALLSVLKQTAAGFLLRFLFFVSLHLISSHFI